MHGRRKQICKECGGKSLCSHGRRKYICKDCGGKGICVHGRRKYICKECIAKKTAESNDADDVDLFDDDVEWVMNAE